MKSILQQISDKLRPEENEAALAIQAEIRNPAMGNERRSFPIHPDPASSGGLLETKRIGDYADEGGVAMAMQFAGTPVSFMANVHCAAAAQNFLALEHHSPDVPFWEFLVKTTDSRKLSRKAPPMYPIWPQAWGLS